ncbi:hypothetical protein PFMG_02329 [Plasmodium falciparum IGH-CR14]|uniref:Protein SYS1 n=3 Tax=Plasmodium falciparum TaxID=5833 RepID=W7K806_PLAFO|nr:hypothetical protein PFNF54_01560 [Plasmodium falciparum NF54]KNC37777.1 hypothetical protein PFLG_02795 [Plasmodium falciparum RAJ116]KNG76020.1 hypothetical protein PFMG_02329 [Plasmodium falciparum IGH-CR14]
MLCLQSIYYSICSFTIFLIFTIYGFPRNIKYLFNTTSYFEGEAVFLYLFFIHIINSIIMSYFIKVIVKRTKKCLDYVLSCYLIHFLLCSLISGLSKSCNVIGMPVFSYLSFSLFFLVNIFVIRKILKKLE